MSRRSHPSLFYPGGTLVGSIALKLLIFHTHTLSLLYICLDRTKWPFLFLSLFLLSLLPSYFPWGSHPVVTSEESLISSFLYITISLLSVAVENDAIMHSPRKHPTVTAKRLHQYHLLSIVSGYSFAS